MLVRIYKTVFPTQHQSAMLTCAVMNSANCASMQLGSMQVLRPLLNINNAMDLCSGSSIVLDCILLVMKLRGDRTIGSVYCWEC